MSEQEGVWRTISGRRVFIAKGQSLSEALKKSGKFRPMSDAQKQKLKALYKAKQEKEKEEEKPQKSSKEQINDVLNSGYQDDIWPYRQKKDRKEILKMYTDEYITHTTLSEMADEIYDKGLENESTRKVYGMEKELDKATYDRLKPLEKANEHRDYKELMDSKFKDEKSMSTPTSTDALGMIKAVKMQEPSSQTLYRIDTAETMKLDKDSDLAKKNAAKGKVKVGDTITMGLRSFSSDSGFVDKVVSGKDKGLVGDNYQKSYIEYRTEGKVRSLDMTSVSKYDQSERLVSGKFKVTKVEGDDKHKIVYIKEEE